jgi:hypothetical protein
MGRFDKLVNILIVILILVYISKYTLEHIQADFFTLYPELNPVNIYFKT